MKFVYATATLQEAEFVIIGVPDESRNTSSRMGSKRAPEVLRKIAYERGVFKRKGRFSSEAIPTKIPQTIHDYGDIDKKKIGKVIEVLKGKIPIIIGGDHSITTEIIKQFPEATVIYFDAHPGIIHSMQGYYGSVLTDTELELGKCFIIGVREPEIQELKNIKKELIGEIFAEEVFEKGKIKAWETIKKKVSGKVYVSIDMNVFDPAIAPGVSAPVPGGLDYYQVLYILKNILKEYDVVGFDIMELTPSFDHDQRTAHLATKLLLEFISNYNRKENKN